MKNIIDSLFEELQINLKDSNFERVYNVEKKLLSLRDNLILESQDKTVKLRIEVDYTEHSGFNKNSFSYTIFMSVNNKVHDLYNYDFGSALLNRIFNKTFNEEFMDGNVNTYSYPKSFIANKHSYQYDFEIESPLNNYLNDMMKKKAILNYV